MKFLHALLDCQREASMDQHHFHIHLPSHHPSPETPPLTPGERHILAALKELEHHMSKTSDAIAALAADVQTQTSVIDSAVTLIQGFPAAVSAAVSEALANAGVDDATMAEAVAAADLAVRTESDKLSAALTANTPEPPVGGGDTTTAPSGDDTAGDDTASSADDSVAQDNTSVV